MKYYDQISEKFSSTDIENAKKYKYNGTDSSICAKLFLRRYWDYLINFFPITMAPNMITLIGFGVEVFSFIVSFFMSDMLRKPVPWWVCFLNGISVHVYQTLDNLDGRQARRTGNSSPLGQFFDHGCDAITGVLEMMKVAISFNFGNTSATFYFVFLMSIGFYFTAWEEYVTHSFNLGILNGPDEGLLLFAGAHILAGIIPTSWAMALALNPLSKFLFVCGFLFSTVPIVINVVKQSLSDKEKMNRAIISIIPALITIAVFLLIASNTSQKGDRSVFEPVNVPSQKEVLKPKSRESDSKDTTSEKTEKAEKTSKTDKTGKSKKEKSKSEKTSKKESSASLLASELLSTNTSSKTKTSSSKLSSSKSAKDSDSKSSKKSDKDSDSKSSKKSDKDSDSDSKSSKKSDKDSDSDSKSSKKSDKNKDSDSKSSKKSDKDSDSKSSKKSDEDSDSKKSDSETVSSLITLRSFMIPFFTMSAGLVLQYQAQQVIVSYLTLREPMRLFEITIYILWGFALVPILIKGFLVSTAYWVIYFIIVMAIMVNFDLHVIFGFSKGLQIPILTIKPKDEEHPEDDVIAENKSEEFQDVPDDSQKEVPLNIFQDAKDDE